MEAHDVSPGSVLAVMDREGRVGLSITTHYYRHLLLLLTPLLYLFLAICFPSDYFHENKAQVTLSLFSFFVLVYHLSSSPLLKKNAVIRGYKEQEASFAVPFLSIDNNLLNPLLI